MKVLICSLVMVGVAAGLFSGCSTTAPPNASDYRLATPESEAERSYLGLQQTNSSFSLEDVRCEVLLIDCFDMYCHLCQSGAKHVNELYQLTQDRGMGNRVKFIGLGVGDTPLEVASYKQKLKVPFPVFPDRRSLVAKRFGPVKLPNLLVLRNQGGHLEVLHRSSGVLLDPGKLLSQIQADLAHVDSRSWTDTAQAAQPTCHLGSTNCSPKKY